MAINLLFLLFINVTTATASPAIDCGLSLEFLNSSVETTYFERLWLKMPAGLRRVRREWNGRDGAIRERDAVRAELKKLIPRDLVHPTVRAVDRLDAHDFETDERLRLTWYQNLRRAEGLLKRNLELTEWIEGARSVASGHAHFALSVYYALADSRHYEISGRSVPLDDLKPYFRAGEIHAREARRILGHGGDQSATVRLHWLKLLTAGATSLAGAGRGGPPAEYYAWLEEADREASQFLARPAPPRDHDKTFYLQALHCSALLRELREKTAGLEVKEMDANARRDYGMMLSAALESNDASLARLMEEKRGILRKVVNQLRWATFSTDRARADQLYEIESMLRSEAPASVRHFRRDLAELGYGVRP